MVVQTDDDARVAFALSKGDHHACAYDHLCSHFIWQQVGIGAGDGKRKDNVCKHRLWFFKISLRQWKRIRGLFVLVHVEKRFFAYLCQISEGQSVVGGDAVFGNSLLVFTGGISGVVVPSVVRELPV